MKKELEKQLEKELRKQKDPRMFGNGSVFDKYPFAKGMNNVYERIMGGEKINMDWINTSDVDNDIK